MSINENLDAYAETNNELKLDIRVSSVMNETGNILAFANVTMGNMVAINGIKLLQGEKGKFVSMPQSKDANGEYHDICHPVTSSLRMDLNQTIIDTYISLVDSKFDRSLAASNINITDVRANRVVDVPELMASKLDVRVYPIENPQGNTLAFASVTVGDIIAIKGVKVINSEKGMFVNMPQSKDANDVYHDVAYPANSELRKEINKAVLDAYAQEQAQEKPKEKASVKDQIKDKSQEVKETPAKPDKAHSSEAR